MDCVFSSNSLSDELQRIFARMPSDFERQATDDTDDFHSNGIDRDFEPILSDQTLSLPSPQNRSDDEDPAPKVYYLPLSLRRPYAARTPDAGVTSQSGWQRQTACVFCRNNGEPEKWYRTHLVRDFTGRVTCPVLRAYRCPICGSTGDTAHTVKYCPLNKISLNIPLPSLEFVVERKAYLWLNSMENPDFNVSNSKDVEISCWPSLQSSSVYSQGGNE